MQLIRCHIEGFGKLSDFCLDFHNGLNAFYMENGAGKTTLCAFIKCMLYGLSESRKQDISENERKHYLPWQGGTFGGSLTVSYEGCVYRISRHFGARPSEDRLDVFDEQTGKKTDALGSCPGFSMLSIDAQGFQDAAVFSERSFSPALKSESVLALFGKQASSNEATLKAALDRLAQDRKQYERSGGRGLLSELDTEISHNTQRQASLMEITQGLSKKEKAFLEAKAALAAFTPQTKKTAKSKKRIAFSRKTAFFSLSGILFAAAGIGAMFSLFSLLLLIPTLFFAFFATNENNCFGFERKPAKKDDCFEQKYKACFDAQKNFESAAEAKSELAYLQNEAERLREKRAQAVQRLSDIKKTEALLNEAERRYREAGGKAILSFFKENLCALGQEGSERFRLDDRLCPTLLSSDAYRSAEALSRAEKDAVSLSRSLALLAATPAKEKPPLLFDDPFLCYDDARLCAALTLLGSIGTQFQILYFTCSHGRMP